MDRIPAGFGHMAWIYTAALAAGLLMAAGPARSDGDLRQDVPPPAYPRWSNDHHMQGIQAGPDCQSMPLGMGADYVRNVDAWGQPVIPADQPPDMGALPLGVVGEVDLGHRHIGGKKHELTGVYLAPGLSGIGGIPLARDCAPPVK